MHVMHTIIPWSYINVDNGGESKLLKILIYLFLQNTISPHPHELKSNQILLSGHLVWYINHSAPTFFFLLNKSSILNNKCFTSGVRHCAETFLFIVRQTLNNSDSQQMPQVKSRESHLVWCVTGSLLSICSHKTLALGLPASHRFDCTHL